MIIAVTDAHEFSFTVDADEVAACLMLAATYQYGGGWYGED